MILGVGGRGGVQGGRGGRTARFAANCKPPKDVKVEDLGGQVLEVEVEFEKEGGR